MPPRAFTASWTPKKLIDDYVVADADPESVLNGLDQAIGPVVERGIDLVLSGLRSTRREPGELHISVSGNGEEAGASGPRVHMNDLDGVAALAAGIRCVPELLGLGGSLAGS